MSFPEIIPANIEQGFRLSGILFLYLLCFMPVCASGAGETRLETSITARMEYNDNILFSRSNIIDDMTMQIRPGLDFGYGTEILGLESGISAEVLRYREHTELDNEYLSADINAGYYPVEKIRMDAGVSVVNDTTLDTELEETGVLITREDRETLDAFGGINYYAGERSALSMEYSFKRVEYDSEENTGYEGDTVSLTYFRRMRNIRDAVTLKPYYSRNDSDNYRVESAGIYAGWSREIDETWSVNAFLGARHTETSYLLWGIFLLEEEKTGWMGDLFLKKKGETWGMETGLTRDLGYSIYGDPIETNRFQLTFTKSFTERLSGGFYGSFSKTRSASSLSETLRRDSWHTSLKPSLRMRFAKELYLGTSYTYSYSHDRLVESQQGVDRNIFRISLIYGLERVFD